MKTKSGTRFEFRFFISPSTNKGGLICYVKRKCRLCDGIEEQYLFKRLNYSQVCEFRKQSFNSVIFEMNRDFSVVA